MTHATAARIQYRRYSMYVVYLVDPNGAKTDLGFTARKTGTGLMAVLRRESVQEKIKAAFSNADSLTFKKTGAALILSNGWRIEFGGTILQERRNERGNGNRGDQKGR